MERVVNLILKNDLVEKSKLTFESANLPTQLSSYGPEVDFKIRRKYGERAQ